MRERERELVFWKGSGKKLSSKFWKIVVIPPAGAKGSLDFFFVGGFGSVEVRVL